MKKVVSMTVTVWGIMIGIIVGLFLGQMISGYYHNEFGHEEKAMDDEHSSHGHGGHSHGAIGENIYNATNMTNPPEVGVTISKDPKSGWNLNVETKFFTFAPQSASLEHVDGEGHGHIYVNGEKIARLYSDWYHIDDSFLELGSNEILVTLNTNDHKEYAVRGEVVSSFGLVDHE